MANVEETKICNCQQNGALGEAKAMGIKRRLEGHGHLGRSKSVEPWPLGKVQKCMFAMKTKALEESRMI